MFRTRRISRIVSVFFVGTLALGSILADGVKQKIRFAKGASSATVSGTVVRGDRDRYYVGARKGQTMAAGVFDGLAWTPLYGLGRRMIPLRKRMRQPGRRARRQLRGSWLSRHTMAAPRRHRRD